MKKSNRDRMTGTTAPDSPQSKNLPTYRFPHTYRTLHQLCFGIPAGGEKKGVMVSGVIRPNAGGISWASLRLNKTNFHGNPQPSLGTPQHGTSI